MTDTEKGTNDYHIGVHTDLARIDAAAWDALLALQARPTPFMQHAFLLALQTSGSARPATGWTACYITLHRDDQLCGATPAYLKTHSRGEYVFDWAWADAYARHGLDYYPTLLDAVPFTPVPGSRLLAVDEASRQALLRSLLALARQQQLSSAHLLFLDEVEQQTALNEGWLMRSGVQFHWHNREPAGYADFAEFLASLQREKRKKIQQERRRVRDAGISLRAVEGAAIAEADWDFFHHCYSLTYAAHQSSPYLTRDFFRRLARDQPGHWLLFIAEREGQAVAASLIAIDRQRLLAWGRYWGAVEAIDCLHFEACYYTPLQWCIEQGFKDFEGGAQGEHKMARGLLPVPTASAHWLAHPQFAQAVQDFLEREGAGVEAYIDELRERNPFKSDVPTSGTS